MDCEYMQKLLIGSKGMKRKSKDVDEVKSKRHKGEPKSNNMSLKKRYRPFIGRYNLSKLINTLR